MPSTPWDYQAGDLFIFAPADGFSTTCAFEQGSLEYYFKMGDIIIFLRNIAPKSGAFEHECEIITSHGIAHMYLDELDNEFIPVSMETRVIEFAKLSLVKSSMKRIQ